MVRDSLGIVNDEMVISEEVTAPFIIGKLININNDYTNAIKDFQQNEPYFSIVYCNYLTNMMQFPYRPMSGTKTRLIATIICAFDKKLLSSPRITYCTTALLTLKHRAVFSTVSIPFILSTLICSAVLFTLYDEHRSFISSMLVSL